MTLRIRLWTAFASNNSGSYTIVGAFGSEAVAAEVAAALRSVLEEHHAFREAQDSGRAEGVPPLHRFIEEQGLTLDYPTLALGEDWPEHSGAPEVTAVGRQVLVHVDMTITMPRTIGELFFRRGGRVEVELDHTHDPVIAIFQLWVPHTGKAEERESTRARLAALREELSAEVLPEATEPPPHFAGRRIEPAWGEGWGSLTLAVVFRDLVDGVAKVQERAAARGVRTHLRVQEAATDKGDPLEAFRRRVDPEWGAWQAVLWEPGANRLAAMKAIRDVAGLGLTEAKARLSEAPCVVLDQVSQSAAEEAVAKLQAAGADAQALGPRDFVRK